MLTCLSKGGVVINEHTLNARQTCHHIEVLGRWFDFIDHDELPGRLSRPKSRPFCLLTFDDGKRSNFTETAPELRRRGIPAIFFVPTRFLGNQRPLWFDRYAALQSALSRMPVGLELETLKELPLALLEQRLTRVCAELGVEPDLSSDDVRPMSWDECRELSRQGFKIGSHSLNHSILTRETQADALADIEQSIEEVTRNTGQPCVTFAFPNGNYTAALAFHAVHCGAATVMTTEPTWIRPEIPLWRLPRIQLFPAFSRSKIELKLALAATGCWLANPDGTGRLYRSINRIAAKTPCR